MGEPCGEGRSPLLRLGNVDTAGNDDPGGTNCTARREDCNAAAVSAALDYLTVTLAPASSKAFLIFSASSFETPSLTV